MALWQGCQGEAINCLP